MQEFIRQATSKLGVDESAAQSVTGGLLKMIQDQADGGDFGQLLEKVPGASDLLGSAPEPAEGGAGGGMVGGLMGKAAGMLGGGGGSALALGSLFEKSGIGVDKIGSFGSMFVDFLKQKAGADLVGRLADQVPQLKKLLG